jgi:hypothetical protein
MRFSHRILDERVLEVSPHAVLIGDNELHVFVGSCTKIGLRTCRHLRSDWRFFNNPRSHITLADTIIYRARQPDCAVCPLKSQCCPNMPSRKIHRSIHEDAPNVARQIATTRAYEQSCTERKKVEMLFAPTSSAS